MQFLSKNVGALLSNTLASILQVLGEQTAATLLVGGDRKKRMPEKSMYMQMAQFLETQEEG